MSDLNKLYPRRESLPDEWQAVFDELVGSGRSPSVVLATIEYVRTERGQQDVADEYHVSTVSIQNNQDAVLEMGPKESVGRPQSWTDHRGQTIPSYCADIAAVLGWDKGHEYSSNRNERRTQVSLSPSGWSDIREVITGEAGAGETAVDHCKSVAAYLGWQDGYEYYQYRYNNRLSRTGWRILHDIIVSTGPAARARDHAVLACPHCGEPALAVVVADAAHIEATAPGLSWCGDPMTDVRLALHRDE